MKKTFLVKFHTLSLFFIFSSFVYSNEPRELAQYRGKFSCFNEESIIRALSNTISTINRFYVDIGAGDGVGWSNSARLALSGWKGLAVEGDSSQVSKFLQTYRNIKDVSIVECIVTPFNVCDLLESFHVPKDFGLLSLDIDSYDYFVLEALLMKFRPSIIVVEINEKIPPPIEFTILYREGHFWDYSNFFGQSICQLDKICYSQNYSIAALEYNNAILVANECYHGKTLTAEEAYLQGYQLRQDRKEHFPWNADMEILLSNSPENNVKFLENYFSRYKGQYHISIKE